MYVRFAFRKIQEMGELPEATLDNLWDYIEKHDNNECYATYMKYVEPDQDNSALVAPLVFDFDDKDNIEQARLDTIKVFGIFYDRFGVEASIYFSGNKGFHLIIPEVVLGLQPSYHMIDVFKTLALNIKKQYKIDSLDMSIYDRKRLLRLNNTKNEATGLYKVQLTRDELSLTVDEIKSLATGPRDGFEMDLSLTLEFNEDLKLAYEKLEKTMQDSLKEKNKYQPKSVGDVKLLPCVKALLKEGAAEGERNASCYTLALFMKSQEMTEEEAFKVLSGFSGLEDREVRQSIKSAYKHDKHFGCNNNDLVQRFCNKKFCKYGYQRESIDDALWNMEDLVGNVRENILTGKNSSNVTLGHEKFDDAWGSLRKEELIVVAADAGIGKSAYMMHMLAKNVKRKNKIMICSLEMDTETLIERTLTEWYNTNPAGLKTYPQFLDEGLSFFLDNREYISFYKDGQTLSVENIKSMLSSSIDLDFGLDMVIIDHLGYIEKKRGNAMWEEYTRIMEDLAQVTKRYKIPIMLLTHFNKGQAQASEKPRSVNDILGTGRIRDLASKVIQIWRPVMKSVTDGPSGSVADEDFTLFLLHKNRYGTESNIKLCYSNGRYL